MSQFIWPVIGGVLIGSAALILFATLGRISGISGIFWSILSSAKQASWRYAFVLGLPLGTWLFHQLSGAPVPQESGSWLAIVAGGILVGFGVHIGSGCTSGHGICGLSRLSMRSMVATLTFMGVGIVTVFVIRHIL